MLSRSLRLALAAAAVTVAASPAAAQQATTDAQPRVVATYHITNGPRDVAFPRTVTVADSAGAILATVSLNNGVRKIPMIVTIIEHSLVLQGQTDDGVLTLVLDKQNEGGQVPLGSGSWTLGSLHGTLRARKP